MRTTITEIISEAAYQFEVTSVQLVGPCRLTHIAHARQACWYAIVKRVDISIAEIARRFHKNHSTVLYGISAAERRAVHDVAYALRLTALL